MMNLSFISIRQRLQKDVALRLGLISAIASLLSMLVLATIVWLFLIERLEARVENSLAERHNVSLNLAQTMTDEEREVVRNFRKTLPVRDEGVFSWMDKEGVTFSGSVTGLECKTGFFDQWLDASQSAETSPLTPIPPDLVDPDAHDRFRFLAKNREQGCLVFGRSLYEVDATKESVKGLLLWLVPLCLIPSLAIALRHSLQLRTRLKGFARAVRAVSTGDLNARVKIYGKDDDIDQLAASTNQSFDKLQDSVGTLQQLTSVMAHDLRAPLNRIAIPLDEALRANENGETDVESLETVKEGLFDVRSIFDALLRISQIESGRRRSNFDTLDLNELSLTIFEVYQSVVEDAERLLEFHTIGTGKATVLGDADLIRQALVNLIENAMRYAPRGSVIRIEVVQDEQSPSLVVKDDGPGLPEEERSKVIRRLYRYDGSTSGKKGHGLGLSLVKAVVDLHEGTLVLDDAEPGLMVAMHFNAAS